MKWPKKLLKTVTGNLPLILALALICVVVLVIWRWNSPYPNIMAWDIYTHQILFNEIAEGKLHLLPSHISDSFLIDSYIPLFALLVGLGKLLFPFLSLPGYYFVLSSLHFLSTVVLSVCFGWVVTKNRWVALISGLLGALVFESTTAQTAFFFLPQSLAATLVVITLILWLKKREVEALLVLALATAMHIVVGGVGFLMITLSWLLKRMATKDLVKTYRLAILIGFFLVIAVIIINPHLKLSLGTLESAEFNLTLAVKLALAQRWYGWLWLFYPVGLLIAWYSRQPKIQLTSLLSLILLGLALFPIPYALKFYTVGRYLVHLVIALGAGTIILRFRHTAVRALLVLLLLATQALVFYYNQATYKQAITYGETITTVSQAEWEAAKFLKGKYGKDDNVLLVSDPATQNVIEGLSGINSQGGLVPTTKTRELIDETYPDQSPEKVKELILKIKDSLAQDYPEKVLLLVSGRYITWQNLGEEYRYNIDYNIWGAKDLPPQGLRFSQTLSQSPYFREVFRNEAMVILEAKR